MGEQTTNDDEDDGEIIVCYGCARPTDRNFADVRCVDEEIIEYLEWPKIVSFSDRQLRLIFAAAKAVPVAQRSDWLVNLASLLGCEPSDDELRDALG